MIRLHRLWRMQAVVQKTVLALLECWFNVQSEPHGRQLIPFQSYFLFYANPLTAVRLFFCRGSDLNKIYRWPLTWLKPLAILFLRLPNSVWIERDWQLVVLIYEIGGLVMCNLTRNDYINHFWWQQTFCKGMYRNMLREIILCSSIIMKFLSFDSHKYHVIAGDGMIPPSQVVSYWRWSNGRNWSNNYKFAVELAYQKYIVLLTKLDIWESDRLNILDNTLRRYG